MIFGWGQGKRFTLVKKHLDFKGKKILDVGCGLGMYSQEFSQEGALVFGIDVDGKKIEQAKGLFPKINFQTAGAEKIPFANNSFDLVFLHEVLEHVKDEEKTIKEIVRVLKTGGRLILFVPNRWFPFETHGLYLGKKYIFGNIPLLNWLPNKLRNIFAPHVRTYTAKRLKSLLEKRGLEIKLVDFVWPAFDRIERKFSLPGRMLKAIAGFAEKNRFLKKLGISIFLIARKK
jgi:SAM-dependent methyltransferase